MCAVERISASVPAILDAANCAAYRSGGAVSLAWDLAASVDSPIVIIILSTFATGDLFSVLS